MIESVVQIAHWTATAIGAGVLLAIAGGIVVIVPLWVHMALSDEVHLPNGGVTYRSKPARKPNAVVAPFQRWRERRAARKLWGKSLYQTAWRRQGRPVRFYMGEM